MSLQANDPDVKSLFLMKKKKKLFFRVSTNSGKTRFYTFARCFSFDAQTRHTQRKHDYVKLNVVFHVRRTCYTRIIPSFAWQNIRKYKCLRRRRKLLGCGEDSVCCTVLSTKKKKKPKRNRSDKTVSTEVCK